MLQIKYYSQTLIWKQKQRCDLLDHNISFLFDGISFDARVVFHITITDVNNLFPRFPLHFLFSLDLWEDS